LVDVSRFGECFELVVLIHSKERCCLTGSDRMIGLLVVLWRFCCVAAPDGSDSLLRERATSTR